MNELQVDGQNITRPPLTAAQAAARDAQALKMVTGLINSPEFSAGSMEGDSGKFSPPPSDVPRMKEIVRAPKATLTQAVVETVVSRVEAAQINFESKVFTTGRLNAGKDTFLAKINRAIHGFADPMYDLQEKFFGTRDKKAPGAREFLQRVGQWGRGTVTDKYPLTPERAVFITLIRAMAEEFDKSVMWSEYGSNDALWVNALIERTAGLDGIGVSNVRFKNEREALTAAGFTHYHVMASPQTLQARWKAAGIAPNSPALTDISEQMAIALDKAALDAGRKPGGKLRVIWSDKQVKSPSKRFIVL